MCVQNVQIEFTTSYNCCHISFRLQIRTTAILTVEVGLGTAFPPYF